MDQSAFEKILRRLGTLGGPVPPKAPCGLPWLSGTPPPNGVCCDGRWHYRQDGVADRCNALVEAEIRARIAAERARLAFPLGKLSKSGFEGFDPQHSSGGLRALETMRAFAHHGKAPAFSVLLVGPGGQGKTHLLLASHFALLDRAVASEYVRTPELRQIFRRTESFDVEVAEEARGRLDRYVYAQAVHYDDAGEIEDDARARGLFAAGLKDLLDRSRARWATATNRSAEEAERHPDLTGAIMSRLTHHCEVVEISGPDYRRKPSNIIPLYSTAWSKTFPTSGGHES